MSILIPGMEMPESCAECRFYGEYCYAKGDENKYSKLPCPLVPVPEHGWIPVAFEDGGLTASIPDEYDGCWIIVTNGRLISVERFKKDAYDHFYPNGRGSTWRMSPIGCRYLHRQRRKQND